ncbi:MAG: hypothetical protein Q7T76_21450 [Ferruginibacter sp.]|nr:hypothetical protein [Ferruginibacter sp.]
MQLRFFPPAGDTPLKVVTAFDYGFPGEIMEKQSRPWLPSKEDLHQFTAKYFRKHSGHITKWLNKRC